MNSPDCDLKPLRSLRNKLQKLFEKAQEQFRHHSLIEKCQTLYRDIKDEEKFLEEFLTALKYSLVYPDKQAVNNILTFVAKFIILLYTLNTDEDDLDNSDAINEACTIPNGVLEFLFKNHGASMIDVRLRCLDLINKILSGMPENSTISDNIWIKLKETILCRIQDKSPAVRAQAVLTGRKLQDPKNSQCEIIKALVFHLNDPSSTVRRAVVSSIAFNKLTVGHVLTRTRDVNENVRRNTYIIFSKVRVLNLTIKYRLTILERGLQDRSALVRNCVQSVLLVSWLENFNNDVPKFLEALDVINSPELSLTVLQKVFKVLPINDVIAFLPLDEETRLIPASKLTPEIALLWRSLANFFWIENNDEELDKILPNITVFCNFIRSFYPLEKDVSLNLSRGEKWEEIKEKEILKHLLELIKVFDFCDELGRSNLKTLIFDMLSSPRIDNSSVECLIELLVPVMPTSEMFLQEVTEIISEIREPLVVETIKMAQHEKLELEVECSNLRVMLNELREEEYEAVSKKDYTAAQSIKSKIEEVEQKLKAQTLASQANPTQEVREEKNDPVTVCKCLTILLQMIKCSNVKTLTSTLRNIKENFLNQCLMSQDLQTQNLAVQVLGQFCVLDLDVAKENLFRFLIMLSENGDDEINDPALKAIFDILLVHGIKPFENLNNDEEVKVNKEKKGQLPEDDDLFECEEKAAAVGAQQGVKFIPILLELLNCKSNDVLKSIAFEGFCKILLSGILFSESLLEKLIINGFSPIIGKNHLSNLPASSTISSMHHFTCPSSSPLNTELTLILLIFPLKKLGLESGISEDNEAEDYIRQVFMVFFPAFALTTPRSQEMIEAAFIPTLKTLVRAPLGSPEADIFPKDVASFLIEYTKPNLNKQMSRELHVHNNLAISMCHEILKEIDQGEKLAIIHVYLKSLTLLELSLDEENFRNQLRILTNKVENELEDKILIKNLKEFKKKIENNFQNTLTSIENTLSTVSMGASPKESHDQIEPSSCVRSLRKRKTRITKSAVAEKVRSTRKRKGTENPENSSESTDSDDVPLSTMKGVSVIPESPELSD